VTLSGLIRVGNIISDFVSPGGKLYALWKKCETFHIMSVKRFTFRKKPVFVEENTPIAQRSLGFVAGELPPLVAYKPEIGRRSFRGKVLNFGPGFHAEGAQH
jgi:hypothetical protein